MLNSNNGHTKDLIVAIISPKNNQAKNHAFEHIRNYNIIQKLQRLFRKQLKETLIIFP
tara:strand:- start:162 stop:335 length:174 start_codon:yes stop_codon:yes gene_type:complete